MGYFAQAVASLHADGADGRIALGEVPSTAATDVADHGAGIEPAKEVGHTWSDGTRWLLTVLVYIVHIGTLQSRRSATGIATRGLLLNGLWWWRSLCCLADR